MVKIAWWQNSFACAAVILAGCAQPNPERAETTAAKEAETVAVGPAKTIADDHADDTGCRTDLEFAAATVYAGATDYYFTTMTGEEVSYRVENEATRAVGFDGMTAIGEEGPPEANPEMIGKKFEVCDRSGQISAVKSE